MVLAEHLRNRTPSPFASSVLGLISERASVDSDSSLYHNACCTFHGGFVLRLRSHVAPFTVALFCAFNIVSEGHCVLGRREQARTLGLSARRHHPCFSTYPGIFA